MAEHVSSTRHDNLFFVWGDTVDLRQLIAGLAAGAVVGYASFAAAESYLFAYHDYLKPGVLMGYALLIGVAGSVFIGALAGTVFTPKRIVREGVPVRDRASLFRELRTDPAEEARHLASVAPDVIAEMRRLGILELFTQRDDAPAEMR